MLVTFRVKGQVAGKLRFDQVQTSLAEKIWNNCYFTVMKLKSKLWWLYTFFTSERLMLELRLNVLRMFLSYTV